MDRETNLAVRWIICHLTLLTFVAVLVMGIDFVGGTGAARASVTIPAQVWEVAAPAGISADTVAEVESASSGETYAVVRNSSTGKVIKTTDYGQTWSIFSLAGAAYTSTDLISVVDPQTAWVGRSGGGVAITGDGGSNWGYQGSQAYVYALEATGGGSALSGGHFPGGPGGFIYGTTSGGLSWTLSLGISNGTCMDIESTSSSNVWAVGTAGYLPKAWHYNGSWTDVSPTGIGTQELDGCWAVDANTAWACGYGKIVKTTNGGTSWQVFDAPTGSGALQDITALDATTAIAVGNSGTIIRTTDGGTTWERMYVPVGTNLKSVYMTDATHAWAVGDSGTVLRMVSSNTPVGSSVVVGLMGGDIATFGSVSGAGTTVEAGIPAPDNGEFDHYYPLKCVDITTSAVYSGGVTVQLPYSGLLNGFSEDGIRVLHSTDGSTWQNATTAIDKDNDRVTGRVDSLSDFAVVYLLYPGVTGVTPTVAARGTTVSVDISGLGYWSTSTADPTVRLASGDVTIPGTNVLVHSLNRITCDFSIPADAGTGLWRLFVTSPDGYDTRDYQSIEIVNATSPTVTAITPATGTAGSIVQITNLAGTGFYGTPVVKLAKAGQTDIVAGNVVTQSATRMTCSFILPAAAAAGAWDVVVINPDAQQAVLSGGFTVQQTTPVDTIAPVTTATGYDAAWHRQPVSVSFSATDTGGSGVAYTEYQIDAGAWVRGGSCTVSGNREHTLAYRSADVAGNVESTKTVTVRVDAQGPATTALAKVTVKKGKKATFSFRITDVTPSAKVTIRVCKCKAIKTTIKVGTRATSIKQKTQWKCSLPKGTYTWKVYATDLAGNAQRSVGFKALVVK